VGGVNRRGGMLEKHNEAKSRHRECTATPATEHTDRQFPKWRFITTALEQNIVLKRQTIDSEAKEIMRNYVHAS